MVQYQVKYGKAGRSAILFHSNNNHSQSETNKSIIMILMMRSRCYWDRKLIWRKGKNPPPRHLDSASLGRGPPSPHRSQLSPHPFPSGIFRRMHHHNPSSAASKGRLPRGFQCPVVARPQSLILPLPRHITTRQRPRRTSPLVLASLNLSSPNFHSSPRFELATTLLLSSSASSTASFITAVRSEGKGDMPSAARQRR